MHTRIYIYIFWERGRESKWADEREREREREERDALKLTVIVEQSDMATRVQTLNNAISISNSINTFMKHLNSNILPPAMGK